MAKKSLVLGGTSGAPTLPGAVGESLSIQFRFEADISARIIELCPPSEEWMGRQNDIIFDAEFGPTHAFELCARRFLRRKVARVSRAAQADYLGSLDATLTLLADLLLAYPQFNHTAADPLQFLEELERRQGKPTRRRDEILTGLVEPLISLRAFAQFQLRALGSEKKESAEAIRRRNDFPRFVLIADIIATYQRVTGEEPMAYAADDEHRSPAVELVTLLVPPILKAARVSKIQISAQTAKAEIATVKRLWSEGSRPEMAHALPSWAKVG
ncbi:MAG: hypothetical protein E5Y12_25445 [Mesorhizobium sp.]|nr:MAG: hypothetical protein E5Y12_25445 [Mesorhizobium sp.]